MPRRCGDETIDERAQLREETRQKGLSRVLSGVFEDPGTGERRGRAVRVIKEREEIECVVRDRSALRVQRYIGIKARWCVVGR